MNRKNAITFAEEVLQMDEPACGNMVRTLMLVRSLSKAVRALDKLAQDEAHAPLANEALRKLGFEA